MTEELIVVRLVNPYANCKPCERVQVDISQADYTYLFRGVLAGCRGAQSTILGTILKKLIEEVRLLNLPPHYDPDNEPTVARIVSRCSFGRPDLNATARDESGAGEGVCDVPEDGTDQSTNPKGKASSRKRRVGKEAHSKAKASGKPK